MDSIKGAKEVSLTTKGTGSVKNLNQMPPGEDIMDQKLLDQGEIPMKKLLPLSYPGDGGFGND